MDKVAYDPDSGTLRVSFQRPGSPDYAFYQVPEPTANGFTTSGLTGGKYFAAYIKGQFPFEPVG